MWVSWCVVEMFWVKKVHSNSHADTRCPRHQNTYRTYIPHHTSITQLPPHTYHTTHQHAIAHTYRHCYKAAAFLDQQEESRRPGCAAIHSTTISWYTTICGGGVLPLHHHGLLPQIPAGGWYRGGMRVGECTENDVCYLLPCCYCVCTYWVVMLRLCVVGSTSLDAVKVLPCHSGQPCGGICGMCTICTPRWDGGFCVHQSRCPTYPGEFGKHVVSLHFLFATCFDNKLLVRGGGEH